MSLRIPHLKALSFVFMLPLSLGFSLSACKTTVRARMASSASSTPSTPAARSPWNGLKEIGVLGNVFAVGVGTVAMDKSGSVYVAGTTNGDPNPQNAPVVWTKNHGYIIKYDNTGKVVWYSQPFGTNSGWNYVKSIALNTVRLSPQRHQRC